MKPIYIVTSQPNFFSQYLSKIYWSVLRYIVYAYWGFAIFINLIMLAQALISAEFINNAVLGNILAMLFIIFFAPFEGLWSIVSSDVYSLNGSGVLPFIGAVSTWVIIIDAIRWIYKKIVRKKAEVLHTDLNIYIESKMKILIAMYILCLLANLVFQNFEGALVYSIFYVFALLLGFPILILAYHIKYPKEIIVEEKDILEE